MTMKRWIPALVVGVLLAAFFALAPAGAQTPGTISACINSSHQFTHVTTGSPLACPSQTPVSWPGNVPGPSPSPSATSASPSPSPTTASPSPSPTSTFAGCTITTGQNCGPYSYPQIPMSNGFDTHVAIQSVSPQPGTTNTAQVTDPGNWALQANEVPYGHGGVQVFASSDQLTNDWNGSGWGAGGVTPHTDTPLSALSSLTINYAEVSPAGANDSYEYAPDVWDDSYGSDIMFWADTVGRCNAGAYGGTVLGTAVIDGQTWTVNRYGGPGAEIIFVLDSDPGTPDSCAQQGSGSIDVLAGIQWLVNNGYMTDLGMVAAINTGWEITSAANATLTVNSYSITAQVAGG